LKIVTKRYKNILFRADSSSAIGLGHIKRDLVLAKRFEDAKITFACRRLEGDIVDEIPYDVVELKTMEKEELADIVKKLEIDLLVIDHYGVDYEQERWIKEKTGVKIFVLDDTYERHYCDILLNHNIGADAKRYEGLVPSGCELRCGSAFALIREEFYKERQKFRVLVAMGGSDHKNLTIEVLKILKEFPHFRVDVVTSRANTFVDALQKYAKKSKKVKLHIDTKKMAKLMRRADFAIITPSVTAQEALFMNLPFIAIKTADNQKEIADYLKKRGEAVIDGLDADWLRSEVMRLLVCSRCEMVPFSLLDEVEKRMVLRWRNSESVRAWMFHKEPIALEDHLAFIERLPLICDRAYFLVKELNEAVGVVDLTRIDYKSRSAHIGLYADPALKGKGDLLMRVLIDYAKKQLRLRRLIAEVYADNKPALALYRRFGFTQTHSDGALIEMELKL
jgi:UDP-2,4-diacetamido-2,4,6-trideoxy-beta-L-altropyranose hydrolase/UDP-4-amino-4,6-dideoxy-N-acetyl-beta-L-altrosamine N-acetyltransferase